ncbi:helix-hairpin-helix domain-containing protein [Halomonas sp. 7T]|uniref:helix-hairpin-helix domain-containing protein n=1 Tax=Halomonas sp. 7T TaxID=2893469 RepID=UPI0021D85672|nr:helix-hairpin-helix domain-containing protein [Halomonas sp. 7T]UXZ55750.1 helix-hairpin-helix domain-containing protein [Halomonas sp. 7T]
MNSDDNTFDVEALCNHLANMTHSLEAWLGGDLSLSLLEKAQHSHEALTDVLATQGVSTETIEVLERIERFIAEQALEIYSAPSFAQQQARILENFTGPLMTLDGIGPATATQLFDAGIAHPNQLFELSADEVASLPLPAASHARVTSLYTQHVNHQ